MFPVDLAIIGAQFGRVARRFDLCVAAQPESGRAAVAKMIVEEARSSSCPIYGHAISISSMPLLARAGALKWSLSP